MLRYFLIPHVVGIQILYFRNAPVNHIWRQMLGHIILSRSGKVVWNSFFRLRKHSLLLGSLMRFRHDFVSNWMPELYLHLVLIVAVFGNELCMLAVIGCDERMLPILNLLPKIFRVADYDVLVLQRF